MPTIDEFKNLNPSAFSNYGADRGNINLLISSSVSASINIPPYILKGMSVPLKSIDGTAIGNALKEVDKLTFDYAGSTYTSNIVNRTNRGTHFYITVQDLQLNATASEDSAGNPRELSSELVFTPFLTNNFFNSDDNPRQGNSDALKLNSVAMVVDRNSSQFVPTNLDAITSLTAQQAQIQDCFYTKAGIINARYEGSKTTSGSISGNDPALGLVVFEASIHPTDADTTTIRNIADRDVVEVRFNSKRIATGSSFEFQQFPSSSNILFKEEGKAIVRVPNVKVYSIQKDEVYLADENGIVTSVL